MANVKTVYLVDYENVGETGLEGAEKLTDKDIVCIFTSDSVNSFAQILKSPCSG